MVAMINGAAARKKALVLVDPAGGIFPIFVREERGEILPKPRLRNRVVEHPHVVRPGRIPAAIGVAIEIAIAGEIVAALSGVNVGLVELVIAGRAIVEEYDLRGRI